MIFAKICIEQKPGLSCLWNSLDKRIMVCKILACIQGQFVRRNNIKQNCSQGGNISAIFPKPYRYN